MQSKMGLYSLKIVCFMLGQQQKSKEATASVAVASFNL